ncbi:MAG: hypothetical protein JXL81_13240, partial [Deltaproteobacteria bacterium]|nr:hypothetical protein [Deltaproteobacteria bacterium]
IHIRGPMLALSTLLVIMLMIPVLYYGINYFQGTDINNARSLLTDFQSAEQQYQSAIDALDRAIEGKFERLDPELMAVFKKNLAIIDDSIRICKESMENSLKTTEANRLLLVCYRKKIELLNEIKELTMQS